EAAIADLIAAFADTLSAQGKTLPDNIRAQTGSSQAHARIGIVATTPNDNNMLRVDLNAIALAERRLWLTDAYFMPTRLYTQALINAAAAGVDVRILVPQTSDIAWIARVSRTRYRELLQAGVRVFEWNGTMIHAKSAVADGRWARIGSTNLNFASWHFNRELDVVLEDTDLAEQLEVQFLRDLDNATEIVLNEAENAVAVERRKQGLLRLKIRSRTQAQAVARQLLRFGHAFEGNFYGAKIVDEREAYAYLSLGAMLLGAGLLLWFFPKLLVMPVMLLLVVGGASTVWSAWRQIRRFHGKK
ncbi:phospholipase D-like domain-containing protein, partial [Conchiformibius steedae]|uniref:phospholipase D-like domain-containing protein n=1 Tax=Conchiformibius steedae TaxID=153493 RepID=UPI0026EFB695